MSKIGKCISTIFKQKSIFNRPQWFHNFILGYVCKLPIERGLCLALIPSWAYNWEKKQCQQFFYGGCGGNGNRFETREACEDQCQEEGSAHNQILFEVYHECLPNLLNYLKISFQNSWFLFKVTNTPLSPPKYLFSRTSALYHVELLNQFV